MVKKALDTFQMTIFQSFAVHNIVLFDQLTDEMGMESKEINQLLKVQVLP